MWDLAWVTDPAAWAGLGTLVLLEVVLGVDNLVFISILVGKLPQEKKRQAFLTGLGLALLMRLVLLAFMARLVMLTNPLFTLGGHGYSARDLILMAGGVFLLLKGTMELHDRLEGHAGRFETRGPQVGYWQVIFQVIVLDAVFSLDSIITSVGMVDHVFIMMLAVVAAMVIMVLAAAPLLEFVERHPTVIVLCLGFLLMIGLSLLADGLGYHIPKGYMNGSITSALTTLHLSVNNHPGVLSHVCGLFAGRAYNLEGVLVTPEASGDTCRMRAPTGGATCLSRCWPG